MNKQIYLHYLSCLINQIFKILPLKEQNSEFIDTHISDIIKELKGFDMLIKDTEYDAVIMRILAILSYYEQNIYVSSVEDVRRNIFKMITLCEKLKYRIEGDNCVFME